MALIPPCPVDMEHLIAAVCASGRLHHLSLSRTSDGTYQASFKRPDTNGYKVHIAKDPLEALERVLGPDYGHGWAEVLGKQYADHDAAYAVAEDDDPDLESMI